MRELKGKTENSSTCIEKGRDTGYRMNRCLLFVSILVILFSSIQIDSSSPTMAKRKRAREAAKKRRNAYSQRPSLNKEKKNIKRKEARSERKVKSKHPTYRGKQSTLLKPTAIQLDGSSAKEVCSSLRTREFGGGNESAKPQQSDTLSPASVSQKKDAIYLVYHYLTA